MARLSGLELLARWRHPDHGMVSPGKFIPVAEGIENETQLEHLLDAECILGQGYLLARPQPLEAFRDELAEVTAISPGE